MTKIKNKEAYPPKVAIIESDFIPGTDSENNNTTVSFPFGAIRDFTLAGLSPEIGGLLKITEIVYSGVLTSPSDVLNNLNPSYSVLRYHLVVVSVNEEKYILKLQNINVGIGQPEISDSDFILIKSLSSQNNYVRQLLVDITDLPESYSKNDVCDYILSLPSIDRTISETDSKWNVVVVSIGEGITVIEIYEIVNIGKGIITTIVPDNLLLITPNKQGLQDVININPSLPFSNFIQVESELSFISGTGTPYNGIEIKDDSLVSPAIPGLKIGKGIGNSSTDASFSFLPNRTIFNDGVNLRGIEYNGSYETNFLDNTLITKKFFEDNLPNVDGSETKIVNGVGTTVNGSGTTPNPFSIDVEPVTNDKQKIITYPTDFTSGNYTLINADNDYTIFIENGANAVSITIPAGLTARFQAGLIQRGTSDVTYIASGTTVTNPIGLKSKGIGYSQYLIQKGSTNVYNLLGNTKA